MENLKRLEKEKKKLEKEVKDLQRKLEEKKNRLYEVERKIAESGKLEELNDVKRVSKSFTEDIKKRPRPSYKESHNEEYEERTKKRQKRNFTSPETIQDKDSLEDNIEIEQENKNKEERREIIDLESEYDWTKIPPDPEKDTNNSSDDITEKRLIELTRRNWSRKEIEDLLEEITEEEIKELESERKINEEEITEEISRLYLRLCKEEGILFEGKRGTMETYYEFGKVFEEELDSLLNQYEKEKTAINKIIKKIMKGGINHDRRNIVRKSEKARKIYRIINKEGGKEKIRRLKRLNSEDYMKFSFKEIEEWVKNR